MQAEKWLGTTNFTSRIAIAGLSIASLSAVAIPFGGFILAGSVATEVISGIMIVQKEHGKNKRKHLMKHLII